MFFYTFIPKLLNMSLTASVAIVFVLMLRLLLKKAPKVISYALWSVVLFRLLCPVSIESGLSLFGLMNAPTAQSTTLTSSIEYVPEDIVHTEFPAVAIPVPGVSEVINDKLPQGEEQLVADPLEAPVAIGAYVWMMGVLCMAAYGVVAYIRLRRKLLTASPLRDNILLADEITSPFVMGLIFPKIYLPSDLEEEEQGYIIRHEQHHIRRGDHIIKVLAFVALSFHWFNPLVWVAFIYSSKDMEMSCDEAVVKELGEEILADYTASLLSLATGRRIIAGMPLAFGEGDPKGRIRNLANWRKPAFWVVLVAVVACIALAVGLVTNPEKNPEELPTLEQTYLAISSKGEEFDVGLEGHSRDSVIDYWGEPEVVLSGLEGDIQRDIWQLNGLADVCLYYDSDGNVEHIKVNQTEPAVDERPAVTWTYSPMMSATWHAAFPFSFHGNYSHIDASCDNGMLWNYETKGQPKDKELRFELGRPIYWMPDIVGETLADTAESAAIRFTVYDGEEVLYKGVLDIIRTGTENGQSFYEARMGGGCPLQLQQKSENMGAYLVLPSSTRIAAHTDLNRNGVSEEVIVREKEPGMAYELWVEEEGNILWSVTAGPAHTGWNTIMLHSTNEGDCLVEYKPSMFQGVGSYTCTVFSLEGGQKTVKEEWTVDFELPVQKTPEMERFAKEVGILLRGCSVLLSTEQGIVVNQYAMASALPQIYPVRFDPDEIQAAIEGRESARELTADAVQFPEEPIAFMFASGAGGWGTELTLSPDGSFTGSYSDSDKGSNAPEYPNGTRYVCEFKGQFSDIRQISDYAWSMKLTGLSTEKEKGLNWIEDGICYIAADPYGVAGGEEFVLYAPETPADELTAGCRSWWPEAYLWVRGEQECLEAWGLCNISTGEGFFTTWSS